MERELQERKMKMAEIIETSNQSYEQRDIFQIEIAAIEQNNRKEQGEFEEQMTTLGDLLDTELQLPTIGNTASLQSKTKSISRKNLNASSSRSATTNLASRNGAEASPVRKTSETNFLERAQNFEEAFKKIQSSTGINDLDEVVKVFIKNEDHNFSLFNYVTEQNNEIEKIEEQIQQLRDEEVKFAQESGQDANQHKEVLKDLEEKLHTSELMAEKYDKHNQELQRIIESLKRGMQSIFIKFDFTAEETGIIDPTVTESNMVNYLAHIERKAANLLQQYSSLRQALFEQSTKAQEVDQEAQKKNLSQTLVTVLGTGPKIPMGETGFSRS